MNPFNNNTPNITASEAIRNKRDKIIFKTEKKRFQTKSKCNNKNVKYYKNGKIRNMHSYKIQQSLARGNALCNDCNNKGLLCGFNSTNSRIKSLSKFTTVNMGNNTLSEFWGHGGWDLAGKPFPIQAPGIPIINSDISGTWSGSLIDPNNKHNITHVNSIPAPFGYANNIIDSDRNVYGNGIVTDPSNILMAKYPCLDKYYNQNFNKIKTFVIITGSFDVHPLTDLPALDSAGLCNDASYNSLIGGPISLSQFGDKSYDSIISGRISKLCCVRNQKLFVMEGLEYTTKTVGIFQMHIELFNINDYIALSNLVNIKPVWYDSPIHVWLWPTEYRELGVFYYDNSNKVGAMGMQAIESIKIYQGLNSPNNLNQTMGNTTKQNYLACVVNGTRTIDFSKEFNKSIFKNGYCENYVKNPPNKPYE